MGDLIIHEAFIGLEVRFYLAVMVKGGSEVVVVFPVSFIDFASSIIAVLTKILLHFLAHGLIWSRSFMQLFFACLFSCLSSTTRL